MQWIQFLTLILRYGPQVFSLVSEIVDLIKQLSPAAKPAAKARLRAAYRTYRKSRNRGPLRSVRDSLHVQRFPSAPPTPLRPGA